MINMKEENKRDHAVLVPYYIKDGKMFVYLQRRDKDAKALPDYFGLWGGKIEDDETVEEALEREIKEELNIEVKNYSHFAHYEFYGSSRDVFIKKVDEDFDSKVEILEGQYGKFFTEVEVINEEKILDEDRVVLRNLFGKIMRNNPYGVYV